MHLLILGRRLNGAYAFAYRARKLDCCSDILVSNTTGEDFPVVVVTHMGAVILFFAMSKYSVISVGRYRVNIGTF